MSFSVTPKKTIVQLSDMSSPEQDEEKRIYDQTSDGQGSSLGLVSQENSERLGFKPLLFGSPVKFFDRLNCLNNRYYPYITVGILCFINLINYMDRFTVAGVLDQVKSYYGLDNKEAGLIQTSFIICYMLTAPVFGYLGDRYNRPFIMSAGVLFWSATTFAGSFVPRDYFGIFILLRALVGTGEASYSTIAPTIIADLFEGSMRSRMLAVFYFAIPIGSGLGYIAGTSMATAFGNWQWALKVTPGLGVLASILTILIIRDPPRGNSEGGTHLENTSVKEDLKDLSHNYSFILSTLGFTCVAFATGALAWWAPDYFQSASVVYGEPQTINDIGLKFGVITCIAGLVGVILGSGGAQFYRKYNERADPLVCASGVLISAPLIFLGCVIAHKIPNLSWALIFFGEVFLCVNWPIVADILLYVVVPTRRSIAEAFQILLSHALGDALSPYIIGAVSDSLEANKPKTAANHYQSLQYAMYITCFVLVVGGALFLMTSLYIVDDKNKCKKIATGVSSDDDDASVSSEIPNAEDIRDSHLDERQLIF